MQRYPRHPIAVMGVTKKKNLQLLHSQRCTAMQGVMVGSGRAADRSVFYGALRHKEQTGSRICLNGQGMKRSQPTYFVH